MAAEVLEAKSGGQEAIPYGGDSGVVRTQKHGAIPHKDMLSFIQTRRAGRAVHSDGFLSVSGMTEPMYVCECGFNGLILDVKCARCGKEFGSDKCHEEATTEKA